MINNKLIIILFFLGSIHTYSQDKLIHDKDIPKLDSIIKTLESKYDEDGHFIFKSLPQTTASYFEIQTSNPVSFLSKLKKTSNIKQLQDDFPGLITDQNLLVIKNVYVDFKKERKINIKSFEIGNNLDHAITLAFTDSLNQDAIKYFYSSYTNKKENTTEIRGFFLNHVFASVDLPKKYANWVSYTDIIVKPETDIFYETDASASRQNIYQPSVITTLLQYYEKQTNKPLFNKEQDIRSRREALDTWQSKKKMYADSLYKNDVHFKELLHQALEYAEENKVTNGDLEDFTLQLISKKRALELMRQNRQVGQCSFDNGPVQQQKRIASLAAQTQNWEVFIKSYLNIMNDNVARIANSNIASNYRLTYIEELAKLNLEIDKILFGSNFRIQDTINKHYFSDGTKIAKAYAQLDTDRQKYFVNTIIDIIKDPSIDAFNKLHFYNTLLSYKYGLEDTSKKETIEETITTLVPFLPQEIKSRIENPNEQLYNLLHDEHDQLDKFDIKRSIIADMMSFNFGGYCWSATLTEKGKNEKLRYHLNMAIDEEITPLKNFLDKKDSMDARVMSHTFLQNILNSDKENTLTINFVNDRSFVNNRNNVTEDMPEAMVHTLNFDDAISMSVSLPNRKSARLILLNNGNLLLLDIPKDFELPGHKFDDLVTKKETTFLSTQYKSFKLFDASGNMLN